MAWEKAKLSTGTIRYCDLESTETFELPRITKIHHHHHHYDHHHGGFTGATKEGKNEYE